EVWKSKFDSLQKIYELQRDAKLDENDTAIKALLSAHALLAAKVENKRVETEAEERDVAMAASQNASGTDAIDASEAFLAQSQEADVARAEASD
ncbi:MAG: hypothetical protein AABZ32_01350, partial [Bacteroidota bacterium]